MFGGVAEQMRYRKRDKSLVVGDHALSLEGNYHPLRYTSSVEHIGHATLASVRVALSAAQGIGLRGASSTPATTTELRLDRTGDDYSGWPEIMLKLVDTGELQIELLAAVTDPPKDMHDTIEELIIGYCLSHDLTFGDLFSYEGDDDEWFHHATVIPKIRGNTVADAFDQAEAIFNMCQLLDGPGITRTFITGAVSGGRPDLLIGQYESATLECKSQIFNMTSDAARIELAQDIARFANAEQGGQLILGLATKKDSTGDRIVSVRPISPPPKAHVIHKALDQRVFPPVEDLTVTVTPATPGGAPALVLIDIPPQREEYKPFLVTGAIVHGKVEGAFISIVRRRGEHSIPVKPESIHAALAAGRALLRGGMPPTDTPD